MAPIAHSGAAAFEPRDSVPAEGEWFRFGDGYLHLQTVDDVFRTRFHDQYGECAVDECPPGAAAVVQCVIHPADQDGRITTVFRDPRPYDQVQFALRSLAPLGYHERSGADPRRHTLESPTLPGMAITDSAIIADAGSAWQNVVGPLAVHRVHRLQPGTMFVHAGSASVNGRGLVLVGPKGAGKTTLSMALADHGHAFYGDEIAAIRHTTVELLPYRRRLSIRRGPASPGVTRVLARANFAQAEALDGTPRTIANPSAVLRCAPVGAAPLRQALFLRAKGETARAEPFIATREHLGLLVPFESVGSSEPKAVVAMRLLRFLGSVRCHFLDLGPIPETVRLIEDLMGEN